MEQSIEGGHEHPAISLDLPVPGEGHVAALFELQEIHELIYGFLYDRRDNPPTMAEIRAFDRTLRHAEDSTERNQVDRRVRELYPYFKVTKIRLPGERAPRYLLESPKVTPQSGSKIHISKAVRARVLAPAKCAMCGRAPLVHDVVLQVDHKLPQSWGGNNNEENLQPLCQDCNAGKKAWFATYDENADAIAQATHHPEPQGRIALLLRAFGGDLVPSDLIGVVASMGAFQEDWQRRLRDLRTLGWKIKHKNVHIKKGTRRVQSNYSLVAEGVFPDSFQRALANAEAGLPVDNG
ncbi:HNH endonuclease [Arthrobacter sp. CJ23]|uniref:HNH endonuclease n=1 Tax=Arthrobacter sp. CJ23 TaxID=2972479 RepID=UPI00215B9C77|nr:HNH endonuclease signature motif containing protein [Arthrobacter sp. CJ23]UVJ38029.1 HNH endonuclease [Arthrobacter sp. CJ23]